MTATAHASGEALDGDRLLVQILGDARDDEEQLRALHHALEAAVGLPMDVHVEGRGARDRRPRPAFELEVPPIPAGLTAANIDDPDVAAEKLLEVDLRFLDAHAYLGLRLLSLSPHWALHHYEVGVRIGELSIGDDFDGVLPGGLAGNRSFLRCLSGYGSCLWRIGRGEEAARVLARALRLDPDDDQGVRSLLSAVHGGEPWSGGARS